MYIKISERVYRIKDLIEFLSKLPDEISTVNVYIENRDVLATEVSVKIGVEDAYLIDCGDHVVKSGEEYPKDLLVQLHDHD